MDDQLFGGWADDVLLGGVGRDILDGGINRDRLIGESAYGTALTGALAERQKVLVEENDKLLQDLEREERELTETRKTPSTS